MTTDPNAKTESRRIKSVQRAAKIVDVIKRRQGGTLAEISAEVDLTKGTVYTYLQTLSECGYVTKRDATYRLSFQFISFGEHVRNESALYMAAYDIVDELANRTGEYVHLIAEERNRIAVLYESHGDRAVAKDYHRRMREKPQYLHDTAAGKAILAHFPAERRDDVLETQPFGQQTENTITSAFSLRRTLAEIRERGFALNDEEEIRGMRAVGAPIVDSDETVVGAVSVTAPTSRLPDDQFRSEMPERVTEAANLIEVNLETSQFDA